MSNGFPSMTALLGLLAIAGYQNRDKIAEMLRGATGPAPAPAGGPMTGQIGGGQMSGGQMAQGSPGGLPGNLGGLLGNIGGGSSNPGSFLGGGISELVDRFRQAGHGDVAESWVRTGPNQEIAPTQLEQTIGPDILNHLVRQTGLSKEEIVSRLSRELPSAVDRYTPDGRIPS